MYRVKESSSICWFNPQMPTTNRAGSGQVQEPKKHQSKIPKGVERTQVSEPLAAASQGAY